MDVITSSDMLRISIVLPARKKFGNNTAKPMDRIKMIKSSKVYFTAFGY